MIHYTTSITSAPLLHIENLTVSFATEIGYLAAVKEITFSMAAGETTCLVGESGCGKSLTAKAILRLTPDNTLLGGRVLLHGTDLLTLREKEMQAVRGKQIAMVFQEPMTAQSCIAYWRTGCRAHASASWPEQVRCAHGCSKAPK